MLACEGKTQSLLDELWKQGVHATMFLKHGNVTTIYVVAEQVEKEKIKFKKKLDEVNNELITAKHELAQSKKAEQSLVEQQNQMSVELISEKRECEKATMEGRR